MLGRSWSGFESSALVDLLIKPLAFFLGHNGHNEGNAFIADLAVMDAAAWANVSAGNELLHLVNALPAEIAS